MDPETHELIVDLGDALARAHPDGVTDPNPDCRQCQALAKYTRWIRDSA